MSEPTDVLRCYVRLVGRLSGASCVTLYVPPGPEGEREILINDGRLDPLPELADSQVALETDRRFGDELGQQDEGAPHLASESADGVLYRVPLRWVDARPFEEGVGPERRRGAERPPAELTAWIGLRFEHEAEARGHAGPLMFPIAAATFSDVRWWKGFLGLATAFVASARTLSRTAFDAVTGLPDRVAFQADLDAAMAEVEKTGRPALLMFVGPDDFGWVNERLGRRYGDRVLREVATTVRAGLRLHDRVARYGGAILTVLLRDTTVEDALIVAENVVRRLCDQRYHGGVLRLEFSAGLAAIETSEPIDSQELIRRADQALSAAKRGNAGSIRVWRKGSDVEQAGNVDRLLGIFTGDKSMDYRNMRLLLESVTAVAASTDAAELAREFAARLLETLHARRAGVLERDRQGGFHLLGGIERAGAGTQDLRVTERDLAIAARACQQGSFASQGDEEVGGLLLCAMPLFLQGNCLGTIVLEVTPAYLSPEGSDRRFLDALAAEMAVALDRARLVERERERERAEKERLEGEVADFRRVARGSRLAYRSAVMESLLATTRKVARTDATVLITGESGTGKEMLASVLHELSARHEKPLVVVDCSAIAPTLIESELFGHERGAFTGAHARKLGRLAQAHGASIFLDEVGDLPLDLQSKLLRFVQEKQFTPLGSVVTHTVDVRIVAATNADLRSKVAEGRFREDLFHRLNVVRLHVPPLRERREDILHLANVFLKQFAALYRRPAHRFTPAAEQALEAYAWPGNVRELQNLVLTSVLFCDAPSVDVRDLQDFEAAARPGVAVGVPVAGRSSLPAPREGGAVSAEPATRLRKALGAAVLAALASGPKTLAPIGKWLSEDLLLTADHLASGISRRGAELLGLPETTYRRQKHSVARRQQSGPTVRPAWWPAVAGALEGLVLARPPGVDLCRWAETCLLGEIEALAPGDARTAAALLGVTEPTLLRRRTQPPSRS